MRTRAKYAIAGALAALISLPFAPAFASSHREAPGITETPKIDGTDFYMFRSYETGRNGLNGAPAYVTFLANYQPLEAPYGGPNYFTMDPDAIYEIHIDNNGDAVEDITYQFKFDNNLINNGKGVQVTVGGKTLSIPLRSGNKVTSATDPDLGETEQYTLTQINGDRRTGTRRPVMRTGGGSGTFGKPLDNVGNNTIPNYATYANAFIFDISLPDCATPGRVFVGQRAEAFAVNLGEVFDLVNIVPVDGDKVRGSGDKQGFPMGIQQSRGNDDVVGESNVTTLALEVPASCLVRSGGSPIIGAWTTASLPQATLADPTPTYKAHNLRGGAYVQKSRLSAPLVNELVIGLPDKNAFNASEPVQDRMLFADYVFTPTLPAILNALFLGPVNQLAGANFTNLAPTNFPRNDLVAAFLTGITIPAQGSTPAVNLNQPPNVVPAEMMRLNTGVDPKPAASQNTLGVLGGDTAGFPNGRRPGDDVVDIELRVAMGALCYANLGLCNPSDAQVGNQAFTDGAPISATELKSVFPYLNDPIPGSPNDPPRAP